MPPATVAEYLATLTQERRVRLEALGTAARAAAPDAVESIAYGMPALRMDGHFLVSWSAFKAHDSLFPASDGVVQGLGDQVAPYVTGRGTLRFPLKEPLPIDLIERIVRIRVDEERAAAALRPTPKRAQRPTGTGANAG